MGDRWRFFIILALLCACGGTAALAAPMPCVAGLASDYMALAMGCTIDGYTLKNFTFQGPNGGLTAGQIAVNPIVNGNTFDLQVRAPFTGPQQGSFAYMFSYFIDPAPIIHEEVDLDPMGTVELDIVLCSVNTVPCPGGNTITTLTTTTNNTMASTNLNNLTMLSVQETLNLTGPTSTSMGFDNFTTTVPEPAAILLTAAGLLGLFGFRPRFKLR